MAKVFYDQDVNWDVMKGKKIAIIGYGSQGHGNSRNRRSRAGTCRGMPSW